MKLLVLAILILPLFPGFASAAAVEAKDVVAVLEEGYRGLRDVQARFIQRSVVAGIDREQKGDGEMALRRGSDGTAMFRFDYRKPQPQQIIYNGKTVWLYQPENRQVVVTKAEDLLQGEAGLAISYLTGLGSISRDFTAVLVPSDKEFVLDLTPRRQGGLLQKLRLKVAAKAVEHYRREGKISDAFPILSSTVYDRQGNRNTMEFSGVRTNKGLDASRFNFRVPEGVQVISN